MGEKQFAKKRKFRLNVLKDTSEKSGLAGLFETFIRKFRTLAFVVLLLPVIFLCAATMGISLAPGVLVFNWIQSVTSQWHPVTNAMATGFALVLAYLIYGLCVVFVVPAVNFCLRLKLKSWRGIWFSLPSIPWYIHNALTYIVRYTFLEFITPSPLNVLFYRMMGMKIGKGVVINSTNISDPCLITLGDHVTIGGSAHLMAHYGQAGFLVLSPVEIGANTTIGLKATVMGGAKIGAGCMIRPHVAILPKTTIPDGESV